MSKLKFVFILLIAGGLLNAVFAKVSSPVVYANDDNVITVYSTLPLELMTPLLDAYTKESKNRINLIAVSPKEELDFDSITNKDIDVYLLSREHLIALANRNHLQSCEENGVILPDYLKDANDNWIGICYDPYVFLVNFPYSRVVGQTALLTWQDLLVAENLKISIEDLSFSKEMQNFLFAFNSHYGEKEAFNYLKLLQNRVPQYAKFPISPIRLTAVGDVGLAITSRNKIIKYFDNNFPAYFLEPKDGTPAQLFGAGIHSTSKNTLEAKAFINWLQTSSKVQEITDDLKYGYIFINEEKAAELKDNELWLNTEYLEKEQQKLLIDKWLQNIRFAS